MSMAWIAVLQMVPWKEVISNAPAVAEGARKLWRAVGQHKPAAQPPVPLTGLSPQEQVIAGLEARVLAVETLAADLHGQMVASSELIKTLAEQNTQLIRRAEINRGATVKLAIATALSLVMAAAALAVALLN